MFWSYDATGGAKSVFKVGHTGHLYMTVHDRNFYMTDSVGTPIRIMVLASDNNLYFGCVDMPASGGSIVFRTGGVDRMQLYASALIPLVDAGLSIGTSSYGFNSAILRHATNPHVGLTKTNATARTGYLELTGDIMRIYYDGVARISVYASNWNYYNVPASQGHEFQVNGTIVANITGSGIRGHYGFVSADGSAGVTQTVVIEDTSGGVNVSTWTLTVKNGIITNVA
jgi:hypothetical protein